MGWFFFFFFFFPSEEWINQYGSREDRNQEDREPDQPPSYLLEEARRAAKEGQWACDTMWCTGRTCDLLQHRQDVWVLQPTLEVLTYNYLVLGLYMKQFLGYLNEKSQILFIINCNLYLQYLWIYVRWWSDTQWLLFCLCHWLPPTS